MNQDLTKTEKIALALLCAEKTRRGILVEEELDAIERAFTLAYKFGDVSHKHTRI